MASNQKFNRGNLVNLHRPENINELVNKLGDEYKDLKVYIVKLERELLGAKTTVLNYKEKDKKKYDKDFIATWRNIHR